MKKILQSFPLLFFILFFLYSFESHSQVSWIIGGRMGLSIADGSAGFHFGPTGEVLFNRNMSVGTEFNINTQSGTPIEWGNMFKYYFDVPGSDIRPYADGGFSLIFVSGGPFFGIRFGGGANFPVAPNLYIPADLQFGPVFTSSSTPDYFGFQSTSTSRTIFYFTITTGIRYYIP